MKLYKYTEDIDIDTSYISENVNEILYFDIETTGLNPERSDLYMIGYSFYSDKCFTTYLLFNDNGTSEPEMLTHFSEVVRQFKYLVSYNGDTFDIPYIKTKLSQFDISSSIDHIQSVDIYKTVRKYKKMLMLSSAKQIDAENLTGLKRKTFTSGGDLIKSYKSYLKTKQESLLDDLLTHNHDDLRGLVSITEFVNLQHVTESVRLINIEKNDTEMCYICECCNLPCRILYSDSHVHINAYDRTLRLTIKIKHASMKYFFKDYKNYYYLPLENTAIHKSMAVYVDSEHKVKATRETAYVMKTADFIPSSPSVKTELFYENSSSDQPYMQITDKLTNVSPYAQEYMHDMLYTVFH